MEYTVHVLCECILHNSVLQACQYVIHEKAFYPLGIFDKNTTWEIVTLAPPEEFEFKITYRNGQAGR